jgi:D-tyrosyl-tRNA(Tyr) deacylase
MIAVIQRVTHAKVEVDGKTVGEIGYGMLVLASVERDDTIEDMTWMAEKLAQLRVFRNGDKHFDQDITQIGGSMLLVSNFTVAAATRKGRRPSLDGAAEPGKAKELFDQFVAAVKSLSIPVATGEFGASMLVSLANDGPSTFIVQTDRKTATNAHE